MADAALHELAARVQALEMEAARRAGPQVIRMETAHHHPRPGTWTGDANEAVCRYCDLPIHQDAPGSATPGLWRHGTDPHCHARAAGAAAKD